MTYSTDEPRWVALKLKLGFVLEMKDVILSAPIAESWCCAFAISNYDNWSCFFSIVTLKWISAFRALNTLRTVSIVALLALLSNFEICAF